MICVFASDATDFATNGLCVLRPTTCSVTETLGGEWELAMTHPLDEQDKWTFLQYGNILKAPVPASVTPRVGLIDQTEDGKVIYKVATRSGRLNLRTGPGTRYKSIGLYKKGTQLVLVKKTTSEWYEMICPDGKRGCMYADYLQYVRTEASTATATGGVIEPKQLREQPFRIYRVVPSLTEVQVYARHIFYDLMDNMIKSYKPGSSVLGATVAQKVLEKCESPHDFAVYSDLDTTADEVEFANVNPVEALLGENGVIDKYGAELARDWYDVYLVKRVGSDSDVQIRQGKNLLGVSYDIDETDVVTRIMPTGQTKDGEALYLDELFIDSEHIGEYPHPKWIHLSVSEAKVGDDMTAAQAKTKLREAARLEFEKGCDLPTITLNVDFINVGDTVEYAQYRPLTDVFLGDGVRVIVPKLGVSMALRMTQYTYDCLLRRYTKVTLGTASETMEGSMISARQLAAGSIGGMKLSLNSIGAGQLQSGSVGSLQIKTAAIGNAHIQNAAIQSAHIGTAAIQNAHIEDATITRAKIAEALISSLTVDSLNAVTAHIGQLAAGNITADELYASLASIAVAQINTANIAHADIDWATIGTLAANIATIALAQISTANIRDANIDWAAIGSLTADVAAIANARIAAADIDMAHIKDMVADTAIITQGVSGELYISRLAVTEANMVRLTVGELVVKGEDGSFYSVSVDEHGGIVTSLKQISNADVHDLSINAGEKLIEGSVTAATLNARDIFADNAIIRQLIAANIDVDTLLAREAYISSLAATLIESPLGSGLNLSSNTSIRSLVQDLQSLSYRVEVSAQKVVFDTSTTTITLSAHLYLDDADVTDDVDASSFIWSRVSGDPASDAAWSATGKTVTLQKADVDRYATYTCHVASSADVETHTRLTDINGSILTDGSDAVLIV